MFYRFIISALFMLLYVAGFSGPAIASYNLENHGHEQTVHQQIQVDVGQIVVAKGRKSGGKRAHSKKAAKPSKAKAKKNEFHKKRPIKSRSSNKKSNPAKTVPKQKIQSKKYRNAKKQAGNKTHVAKPKNKAKSQPHKNSLQYVGPTHVYAIKGPNGTHKIGESAQGARVRDGASKRAEQQSRSLIRQNGPGYRTSIRKTFPNKRAAREYETRLIERYRSQYGQSSLPGNKTNR